MPKQKKPKSGYVAAEEPDEELEDVDEPEEGKQIAPNLVQRFIRMWPRAIFYTSTETTGKQRKPPSIAKAITVLDEPGVYVLYRDDQPFYVGQARILRKRLRAHANNVGSSRNCFWNYFSAFIVKEPSHIDEVEAILIAAMPSVITNSAKPKLPREKMGKETRGLMRQLRTHGQY